MSRGPTPGSTCSICLDSRAPEINAVLHAGILSVRRVAKRFDVSRDALVNHARARHPGYYAPDEEMPGQRGAGVGDPPPAEPGTELDRLRKMRTQLEQEMERRARPEISRELRQVNQRIAELEGESGPKTLSVADVQGLPEQVARWFAALEPYPDAREAMLRATDPQLLDRSGVSAEPAPPKAEEEPVKPAKLARRSR